MSDDTPRIEVTIAAPVDAVWRALRDRDQIRDWHGWEYDEGGGLDAEIQTIFFDGVVREEATSTLELKGGDRFTVEPVEGGTRIRITRATRGGDQDWDAYYDDITQGWTAFLQQLRFALERQPGAPRRTVFFDGTAGPASPIEELGLTAVAQLPAGRPYTADLAGEAVSGEVWYRTDHQLGLTVDGWGGGLLIVAHTPTMAILSTYGLPDAALDALRDRWSAWWTPRYASA